MTKERDMNDEPKVLIYLNNRDSLALRYLMEYEHQVRMMGDFDADDAAGCVISTAISKLWEVLDNLELFSTYGAVVVVRNEDGTENEFDWQTVCDGPDYGLGAEPNSTISINQRDFILLEASLRRTLGFITSGRVPSREEMVRIALRFRAAVIRHWNKRAETKQEFGIRTPRGLLPLF